MPTELLLGLMSFVYYIHVFTITSVIQHALVTKQATFRKGYVTDMTVMVTLSGLKITRYSPLCKDFVNISLSRLHRAIWMSFFSLSKIVLCFIAEIVYRKPTLTLRGAMVLNKNAGVF